MPSAQCPCSSLAACATCFLPLPLLTQSRPLPFHTCTHTPSHREAVKRGDIMFVGSSGNNGTTPTLQDGKLTSSLNPGNFPGALQGFCKGRNSMRRHSHEGRSAD
jgi:hypothetical protein